MRNNYKLFLGAESGWGSARPRVYCGPKQLQALKPMIATGDGRALYQGMLADILPLVEQVHACDDLPALLAPTVPWMLPVFDRLMDMSLAGVLGGDDACRQAAVKLLLAIPEADRLAGRKIGDRLCMARSLPLQVIGGLDMVWDVMPQAGRDRLVRWLVDEAIKRSVAQLAPSAILGAGANIPIGGMVVSLMALLCVWGQPAAGDLSPWREELLTRYKASVCNAMGVDGYPDEDMGYGPVVVARLVEMAHTLHRAGWMDAFEELPRLKRFARAMLAFMQPWGLYLSNTGDHTDNFRRREFSLLHLAAQEDDGVARWLATALTHDRPSLDWLPSQVNMGITREIPLRRGGQLPASSMSILALPYLQGGPVTHPARGKAALAFCDRQRGLVSFRDSWKDDATLLLVDGSQRRAGAQGHFHASCGHFSLTALGEYFAIDMGRYGIDQDQHNLLLHRGVSGHSSQGKWTQARHHGVLTAYDPHELCDVATVDSSHQYENVRWARRGVGLVKHPSLPAYAWTVDDINGDDTLDHDDLWTLNTSPENVIRTHRRHATITGCRHGHHLDVHWALAASPSGKAPGDIPGNIPRDALRISQDVATTSSWDYVDAKKEAARHARPRDMVHGAVFVRPRLLATLHRSAGKVMAIMLPRPHGQSRAKVRQLPSLAGSVAMSVEAQGVRDVLIWAFSHQQLRALDTEAVGQFVMVRQRVDTGRLLGWRLFQGESLKVKGKRIV